MSEPSAIVHFPPRPSNHAAAKKWDAAFAMVTKAIEIARRKELVGESRKEAARKAYLIGAQMFALELREPGRSWTLSEVIEALTRPADRQLFGLSISDEDAAAIAEKQAAREKRLAEAKRKADEREAKRKARADETARRKAEKEAATDGSDEQDDA